MALLMYDGFEAGQASFPVTPNTTWWINTEPNLQAGGRTGSWELRPTTSFGSTATPTIRIYETCDFVVVGYGTKISTSAGHRSFIRFGTDAGATIHIYVEITNAGVVNVRHSTETGTILATYTAPGAGWIHNTWAHFQIKVKIHDSSGQVIVKYNDQEVINFTGDTRNAGTGVSIDTIQWRITNAFAIDDVWVVNETNALSTQKRANNDFLGTLKVYPMRPDGIGATQTWSVTGAATHHEALNETPPSDADYISRSATSSGKDLVEVGDITSDSSSVIALNVTVRHKKSDAGNATLKTLVRWADGTEEYDDVDIYPNFPWLSSVGKTHYANSSNQPITLTNANALQAGVAVTLFDSLQSINNAYFTDTLVDINSDFSTLQDIDDATF